MKTLFGIAIGVTAFYLLFGNQQADPLQEFPNPNPDIIDDLIPVDPLEPVVTEFTETDIPVRNITTAHTMLDNLLDQGGQQIGKHRISSGL